MLPRQSREPYGSRVDVRAELAGEAPLLREAAADEAMPSIEAASLAITSRTRY